MNNLEVGSAAGAMKGDSLTCYTWLIPFAFLENTGPLPKHGTLTVAWTLAHQSLEKCPTGLPKDQYDGGIFLIEIPSSYMTLACIKLTKPNQCLLLIPHLIEAKASCLILDDFNSNSN